MQQHSRSSTITDFVDILSSKFCLTLHDHLITFDRNHLAGILINEVLIPTLQYTSSQLTTYGSLHIFLIHLYLLSKVENLKNILILLITNSTEQGRYRQLLLTVDVSIHHIVDICSKLYPTTLEWDYTRRIKHSTIGMNALTEEHTR